MKVAFISTLYAPNHIGGAEQAVRLLAESLVARGHEAVVISLDPTGKFDKRVIEGVTVHYVPLANIYWPHVPPEQRPPWRAAIWHLLDAYNPIMGARVRKILAAEKPDVVESNNLQGFSVAAWRAAQRLGIPVVQILHDYYLGCPNSSMFKRGRNCARQCGVCAVYTTPRRLLSGIPKVVSSVSRHMLERLERTGMFGHVSRQTVVRTAFNFAGDAKPRSDKPPGSRLTIGYMGRLEEVKGIELLLRALRELPTEKITLLIAGSGVPAYVDDLKRRYGRANIQFLGFTEPSEFFSRIDAVVVPSVWEEPLSRVIFEGCAFGVPAIVARIGGMPEIVEEGVTGYVFESNDVVALVAQLRSVIDQGLPAQRMQEACRKKSTGFGVDEVFRAHMANWRHAIAQQSPGLAPRDLSGNFMKQSSPSSAAEPREALRVLAFPKAGGNTFLGLFTQSLEAGGARVDDFNFWRAYFGSYDVVHIHWPDTHLRTHSWWRAVGKHARLALLCMVLRARGTRIVWMMHNLKPHEKDHWISSALFPRWFPQLCTHVIALTAHGLHAARQLYPALHDKPAAIVPHGHYRSVYPDIPTRAAARRQFGLRQDAFTFLFFGNIRRYKNVPHLIRTFRQWPDRDVQLVVAGLPVLGVLPEDLQALAAGDERIHLHLKFVPDEEVALYLAAADKVVLPFDSILNSGSVLLALSLNRTVMAPRMGALPEIEAQVGPRWLQLYDGELTPQLLAQARANGAVPAENEQPDLSAFDWDAIGRTTLEFYRSRRADAASRTSNSAPLRESSSS